LDHLHSCGSVDVAKIVIFGRSLGGAVAIALAAVPGNAAKFRGLCLENTFTRIDDMVAVIIDRLAKNSTRKVGAKLLPLFYYYISNPWRSIVRISKVTKPILFISGLKDQLIPPAHMQQLFAGAQAASAKWMHTVSGAASVLVPVVRLGTGYLATFSFAGCAS
jgi:fermentation-respiration switch protein FrsA (DUF1100 family)